jgi:hypothetical protein
MNIIELAKQAGLRTYQEQAPGIDGVVGNWADLETFAELIVRECAGVCHTYGWGMLEHGRPGNSIADDCGVLIKQHFGVEE